MLPFSSTGSNPESLVQNQLHYQLSQTSCHLMAVLACTIAFCALQWMNTGKFSLFIIILENIHPSVKQEAWQSITCMHIYMQQCYIYTAMFNLQFSLLKLHGLNNISHWPFSDQYFSMGKPLIVNRNVPAYKEWPTNFKLLFQTLSSHSYSYILKIHTASQLG